MTERRNPEDAAAHITVSDPVQHADGLNKYTSYRVDVRSTSSSTPYSAVLRRYSDFLWLFERLHRERAGAIVPPLPDKQAVARFSAAFVEDRRINLEKFLRRVSLHPELSDATCLSIFLTADDATFHAAKSGHVIGSSPADAAKEKQGIKQWFAETKTSIMGNSDLVPRSPDDDLFDEIERYVHGLDAQMKNVAGQASGLVRKGKEIANGMFEFGLAFSLLGQSEADGLGVSLAKMGDAADALSVLSAEQAEREAASFEEPLQDYIRTIHAVKLALSRRSEKRLTLATCLADVNAKTTNLNRLRGVPGKEDKAYQAETALVRAKEDADHAREDFATVSQRVLREVDRFKREKADDMRRTVMDYIHLQITYNKRMEEVWAKLIPQLEQVQLDVPQAGDTGDNNGNQSEGADNAGANDQDPMGAGAASNQAEQVGAAGMSDGYRM